MQLLFESTEYSRVVFILLSQSLRWRRREWSSTEWLLDRQENLLVVADWFTSLFWVCFVSSQRVFACTCATQVFVKPTVATIQERHLFCAAHVEVWLWFESGYWSRVAWVDTVDQVGPVIVYATRSLTSPEWQYSTIERECAAVILCTKTGPSLPTEATLQNLYRPCQSSLIIKAKDGRDALQLGTCKQEYECDRPSKSTAEYQIP